MLVLLCLSENGKYDVTRKGKPSSTAPFSSLLLASLGGWASTATATSAITARSFCLGVFHAPPGPDKHPFRSFIWQTQKGQPELSSEGEAGSTSNCLYPR